MNLPLVLLLVYSVGLIAIGIWVGRLVRGSGDFFVAGRSLTPGRQRYVYTGSTPAGFYDLGAIARGVAALRQSRPDLAGRIQLVFVGACNEMR